MRLFSSRLRIALIAAVWLIAVLALLLWFSTHQTQRLTLGGGPAGSESLALSKAIAEVLNSSDEGLRITVYETGGSYENLRLLKNRRIDLGEIQADAASSDGVLGLMSLYADAYHLIVRGASDINSFPGLRGYRVAIPPGTSGQFKSFWFLAAHYGISPADITALPMSEPAANFAMQQGQVDAVFRVRAPGNAAIRQMIGDKQLRLVSIVQTEALSLKQPAIDPGIIPMGSYRGSPVLPAEDLQTGVVQRLLVARDDLAPEIAYRFTRSVFEHRADILEYSRLAGLIGPLPDDARGVIAAHPGARSYYDREKPGFLQRNARIVSTVLYVVAIASSALLALRTQWVRSRRLRMNEFNAQLMQIAHSARQQSERDALDGCKEQLIDILQQVVGDLESERVSQAEFEHFSFTWQAVDALVRDRVAALAQGGEVRSV
ncbi:MAG: TAXI family TRAP transporter solute-binding subunit [Pseudomonadota bacterium]